MALPWGSGCDPGLGVEADGWLGLWVEGTAVPPFPFLLIHCPFDDCEGLFVNRPLIQTHLVGLLEQPKERSPFLELHAQG